MFSAWIPCFENHTGEYNGIYIRPDYCRRVCISGIVDFIGCYMFSVFFGECEIIMDFLGCMQIDFFYYFNEPDSDSIHLSDSDGAGRL